MEFTVGPESRCPPAFRRLIEYCCRFEPNARPTMAYVVKEIERAEPKAPKDVAEIGVGAPVWKKDEQDEREVDGKFGRSSGGGQRSLTSRL